MPLSARGLVGRLLYALLFLAALPAALVGWAAATEDVVPLPAVHATAAGIVLAGVGLALLLVGMWGLLRHGGGLPMNAFPPPRYVDRGVYGLLADPIYVGFALMAGGTSVAVGSASGLWLVTPLLILAMTALVVGYERPELRRRFGDAVRRPRLALPRAEDRPPTGWERAAAYVQVLLPWAVLYEAVQLLGAPPDAVNAHLPFEAGWPVLQWTEWIYASAYVLVLLTPLVSPSAKALRRFAVAGLVATFLITLVYLVVPLVSPPRPFEPSSLPGRMLYAEAAFNNTVAAFPSFHALWVLLAAAAWPRRLRPVAGVWAVAIAASCITTGMHALVDVLAAAALAPLFHRYDRVWAWLRRFAERVANSWAEWRFGPMRILNRAFYIFAGGLVGGLVIAIALGEANLPALLIVGVTALLGAALWAQWLEGSPALLRPFGFYGGLLGGILGAVLAWGLGYDLLDVLAAFSLGLPFTQGLGRFGCLINGCCHGGPTSDEVGIRYRHTRSRVTRIAGLVNVPLHPTQLYSVLANALTAAVLLRLWWLGASPALVLGLYFVLGGLARFVEESYRDEPQTPTVLGLHVYHWLAIASVVGGAVVTTLPAHARMSVHPLTPGLVLASLAIAAIGAFVMGVDFPSSSRRFSRLAPADGPVGLIGLDVEDEGSEAEAAEAEPRQQAS